MKKWVLSPLKKSARILNIRLNAAPKLLEVIQGEMRIRMKNWMRCLINVSSVKALEHSFWSFHEIALWVKKVYNHWETFLYHLWLIQLYLVKLQEVFISNIVYLDTDLWSLFCKWFSSVSVLCGNDIFGYFCQKQSRKSHEYPWKPLFPGKHFSCRDCTQLKLTTSLLSLFISSYLLHIQCRIQKMFGEIGFRWGLGGAVSPPRWVQGWALVRVKGTCPLLWI